MQRIAEQLAQQARDDERPLLLKGDGKAAFLALKDEIEEALNLGWPALKIWTLLYEQQRIHIKYPQFGRYVRRYIQIHKQAKGNLEAIDQEPAKENTESITPTEPTEITVTEQHSSSSEDASPSIRERDKPEYAGLTPKQRRERVAQKFIKDSPTHPLVKKLIKKQKQDT